MVKYAIALFGESRKGKFSTPYYCESLLQLSECIGDAPEEGGRALDFAVQSLLFNHPIIFFRVEEEGFSVKDYFSGLQLLKKKEGIPDLAALCLPGVGDREVIEATQPICSQHNSLLIFTNQDLYDFLTHR